MNKDIFSGLEDLGFDGIGEVDLFNNKEEAEKNKPKEKTEDEKIESQLYEKQYTCPVCGNVFKVKAVKTNAYRIQKRDSDLFNRYTLANPYFYDVILCNSCGYTAMGSDFTKIKTYQIPMVQEKITSKWRGKDYPDIYNVDIAIERYKLALLNYVLIEAKASKKAVTCLKIAWMYRLKNDEEQEQLFLKQAVEGLKDAYLNEDFPFYGMDRFTITYLIGELNRRIHNNDEAMQWFSNVIVLPAAPQKIKDLARDQKDLIKEDEERKKEAQENDTDDFSIKDDKKQGFFKRLFK